MFEEKQNLKKKKTKIAPPKTHHDIHSTGDRDHLETARDETRSTR